MFMLTDEVKLSPAQPNCESSTAPHLFPSRYVYVYGSNPPSSASFVIKSVNRVIGDRSITSPRAEYKREEKEKNGETEATGE